MVIIWFYARTWAYFSLILWFLEMFCLLNYQFTPYITKYPFKNSFFSVPLCFFKWLSDFTPFLLRYHRALRKTLFFTVKITIGLKVYNKNRIISENADCIDYLISSKWRLLLEFYQISDLCILERGNMYHWHMVQPNPYFWKLLFKKPSRK